MILYERGARSELDWARCATDSVSLRAAKGGAGLESGDEGAPVLLLRLREYVLLLGWLALAALTGAVLWGLTKSLLRVPLVTVLLVIGAPTLLLGGLTSARFGSSDEEVKTESAPGRGDGRLVVVARSGSLDPVWCVYVDQGDPPLERRLLQRRLRGQRAQ